MYCPLQIRIEFLFLKIVCVSKSEKGGYIFFPDVNADISTFQQINVMSRLSSSWALLYRYKNQVSWHSPFTSFFTPASLVFCGYFVCLVGFGFVFQRKGEDISSSSYPRARQFFPLFHKDFYGNVMSPAQKYDLGRPQETYYQ